MDVNSWIEACIGEEIPATVELEEGLRNGVVLAKLAHFIIPDKVPLRKVYDKDLSRYNVRNSLAGPAFVFFVFTCVYCSLLIENKLHLASSPQKVSLG